MGESACLMHDAFSYTSGLSNDANQGNPIHGLGESISFGRFTSESLAWERWSSFTQNNNRYVEEAERYSRPGSVAQKKAFFEAHYQRIAAQKAAALLEQENAALNNPPKPEVEAKSCHYDSPTPVLTSQLAVDEQESVETHETREVLKLDICKVEETDSVSEHDILVKDPTKDEPLNRLENVEGQNVSSCLGPHGTPEIEKPLLKSVITRSLSKKKPAISPSKPSLCRKGSKLPSSPAKFLAPLPRRKEDFVTPSVKISTIGTYERKRSTPKSLSSLMNYTPARENDKLSIPATRKGESSKTAPSFFHASKDCATPLRTPTMASVIGVQKHPSATPCSENRRTKTPLNPSASGSKTAGPKWHILSAVSDDCSYVSSSKSLSACRKKLQSPNLSTPLILRTEERAARRKQASSYSVKLEEKFNDKEAQKVQLQTKFKEKAETELRKLRQSLCFKARPLPDFYRERERPMSQKEKPPAKHPQSPKQGRKLSPKTTQATIPLPPPMSSITNYAAKNVVKKSSQVAGAPSLSFASVQEMITHENTSPNIQI
ncbi:hypothetical protein RJ639_015993 [Escallonia herrerae]|uniref:TPX2 C-terminal domain-containing protein n=1 Tax=Escallonia herrerae TaxID=1293975 RepID=A0AA88VFJ6_9ASTE|nr:hypothetical protein RJ639_015993 [Escallonia herrerae]